MAISRGCHSHLPKKAFFVDFLHGRGANPIPPAFLNILREPFLLPKQKIPHIKALIYTQILEAGRTRAKHYQGGAAPWLLPVFAGFCLYTL